MINKINEIIDEKEQYQLQALRLEAENTTLKAILTKRDESVTEQTKIILNLEAENKRLKDIIKALKDTVIQWKKEYDIIDSIVDLKDAVIAELKAENENLKEENYQLQKDCQICENFIDFIPCKPIRDMDYDLQKVINQRDKYIQTLQEIKAIAETPKPFIDNLEIKSATEVGYDYAAICNELELRLHKVLELITKAESEG